MSCCLSVKDIKIIVDGCLDGLKHSKSALSELSADGVLVFTETDENGAEQVTPIPLVSKQFASQLFDTILDGAEAGDPACVAQIDRLCDLMQVKLSEV